MTMAKDDIIALVTPVIFLILLIIVHILRKKKLQKEIPKPNRLPFQSTIMYLCKLMDQSRKDWFKFTLNQCDLPKTKILSGPPLYEVISYQMYIIASTIARYQYIKPVHAHDFIVLLQTRFFGEYIDICKSFYVPYLDCINKPKEATEYFIHNMTKHLLGFTEKENPKQFLFVNGGLHIANDMFLPLIIEGVARCFGDNETVEKQKSIIKKILSSYNKMLFQTTIPKQQLDNSEEEEIESICNNITKVQQRFRKRIETENLSEREKRLLTRMIGFLEGDKEQLRENGIEYYKYNSHETRLPKNWKM
jgi:hypothetical protein